MRALAGGAKPKRFTDRAIHARLFTGFNTATFPASILHFDTRNAATIESTMAERRSKRPKITSANVFFFQIFLLEEDDYLPGNITEIELHNFMTFNDLKCKPGSRLNLVIGPNGSGKSSLCAIALGLGGDPQHWCICEAWEESGYIKISLRGTLKRSRLPLCKIDTRNKSEWLFNGNHFWIILGSLLHTIRWIVLLF
ncbi:hypothetical protein AAG906_026535 [Vitis piasezkii]